LRHPLKVDNTEVLARQLFSSYVKKNGQLTPTAFIASEKSGYGISVHRWSLAPERLFKQLGFAAAARGRGGQRFKGFATFPAASLATIKKDEFSSLKAIGVPTARDPFHADIPVSREAEDSYYLEIASEILEKAKPHVLLYPAG
jgi:hypothetical protein